MNALLLTPYIQSEVGIAFVRLPQTGRDILKDRILILPEPDELKSTKSGVVDWKAGNDESRLDPLVVEFIRNPKVQAKLQGVQGILFQQFVSRFKQCQLRDGEYCHHELTLSAVEGGFIRTCWHHDNELRNGHIDEVVIKSAVEKSRDLFAVHCIQKSLKHNRTLTLADVVLFACKHNLTDCLTDKMLRTFFNLPAAIDDNKESSTRFEIPSKPYIEQLAKAVVELQFDDDPPAQYMLKPKPLYFRSEKWLRWVKSQPCVCCGKQADDPHHLINQGQGTMGGKADDFACIPLCRQHHNELHRDPVAFERQYGSQKELWYDFFMYALKIGAVGEV